jgi:vacuolar protein sorting-associated protein 54
MFFDSNFDIANPSTWAEVMEAAESSSKPRDTAVQESLSTHLDNLESHLVHEITLRSSSFFSALSNLQDLNSESTSCLTRISDLKTALADVGGKQARKGLEIIDAQSRLQSLRVTERGLKRLAELDDFLRIAKGMADGGDWAGALACVEDVVRWWERNGPEDDPDSAHLPLTTLPALGNLPTSITVLTSTIASQLEGALSYVLLSTLVGADNGGELNKEQFRVTVRPMLIGLVRCGKLGSLGGVWRAAVTTSVREGLRQVSHNGLNLVLA